MFKAQHRGRFAIPDRLSAGQVVSALATRSNHPRASNASRTPSHSQGFAGAAQHQWLQKPSGPTCLSRCDRGCQGPRNTSYGKVTFL